MDLFILGTIAAAFIAYINDCRSTGKPLFWERPTKASEPQPIKLHISEAENSSDERCA